MTSQTIVGDSSPLIALAIVDQLELLPKLYQQVVIPPAVWDEVTVQGAGLPGSLAVSRLTWLEKQTPSPDLLRPLAILLDRGRAGAIAAGVLPQFQRDHWHACTNQALGKSRPENVTIAIHAAAGANLAGAPRRQALSSRSYATPR